MKAVLGIDTSCYTTSCALVSPEGEILADARQVLPVGEGQRGFRQSTALFHHVQQLPGVLKQALDEAPDAELRAVAVSTRPRDVEGSYMPVFLAGENTARSVAAAMRLPLLETSHQRGHIYAALAGRDMPERFYCLHLSGGTTETLLVEGESIEIIGEGADLQVGQFVDRVGVSLGLPFPSGRHLEALALEGRAESLFPASVQGFRMSFSGAETQAQRLIGKKPPEDIAREVYSVLARSLAKLFAALEEDIEIVLMGGVASSALLRELITERMNRLRMRKKIVYAPARLASDNAVGVALYGAKHYKDNTK